MKKVKERPRDLLGAHISVAGGIARAPRRASALPAEVMQIFTKNQNQWQAKPLTAETIAAWLQALADHDLIPAHVCSHDSYLINLAAVDPQTLRRSHRAFVDEIERCAQLHIPYLIFHPGSHMGRGEVQGIEFVARQLDLCLEAAGSGSVPDTEKVSLCLETTAGQGSNLGYRFEHLRDIIAASRYPDRLAVCLDTCHIFAAGYRLDPPRRLRRTLTEFETTMGLDRLRVLHLNDSRRACGSRVDRHARIGQGEIGVAPFRTLLRIRRLKSALKILEVPGGEQVHRKDLALLRRVMAA